jgi:iron complex transport system ATP-binding protein
MKPVLTAAAVSVRIGAKRLLDDIDLSFEPGEAVALVGPNGAGKSTLLRVLSASLKLHAGEIRLNGRELSSYPPEALALHRAVLSQQTDVAFPFAVADIVRMGIGRRRNAETERLVDAVLAELDLLNIAERAVTTLSGGEQQRVHIARVLAQLSFGQQRSGCGILLLDEPTSNLDLRHQLAVFRAVQRRARHGVLVVSVLHDLNLACMFARRIIVLDHGSVDSDGPPAEIISNRMLARVFGIETAVGLAPAPGIPFVLPQTMTAVPYFSGTRE